MTAKHLACTAAKAVRTGLVTTAMFQLAIGSASAAGQTDTPPSRDNATTTPIKHVIVIIGENRTFDHVFATYSPTNGQTVNNLLSEGIVKADGTPGANSAKAAQISAQQTGPYPPAPTSKTPYTTLPPPSTDGAPVKASDTNPPP